MFSRKTIPIGIFSNLGVNKGTDFSKWMKMYVIEGVCKVGSYSKQLWVLVLVQMKESYWVLFEGEGLDHVLHGLQFIFILEELIIKDFYIADSSIMLEYIII